MQMAAANPAARSCRIVGGRNTPPFMRTVRPLKTKKPAVRFSSAHSFATVRGRVTLKVLGSLAMGAAFGQARPRRGPTSGFDSNRSTSKRAGVQDMNRFSRFSAALLAAYAIVCGGAALADPSYTRQQDVIYGRKYGTALTMDVFTPNEGANGAAVVVCISGGWISDHENIRPFIFSEFLKRGYTVFAVVHGSQPKFTIPECVADMNRAVRFVRSHAADYKIDPQRIGITGASAGGHLSLMLGTAGTDGDPKAKDPVDRVSSRVQAVACFFPPTDFLNYGKPGYKSLGIEPEHQFKAPFDFRQQDPQTKLFKSVDLETREQICKDCSPIYHVSKDDAPTLILHGDADTLVPLQQSEIIVEKFNEAGVPVELVVKKGAGHGLWPSMADDLKTIADWFDKHLQGNATAQAAQKPAEQSTK
jgi:acetyl esterase/lipase